MQVPDYCYTGESEDEPDTNVWIGPRGTVSPAHTDPKHNVLCQVVRQWTRHIPQLPIVQAYLHTCTTCTLAQLAHLNNL